ncbi:hypothetical protein [Endozoicomonas elysicola]|uniref:Uncharacterized protein n=1 Tax=Endozoicomonas elysicola TaxID=305900 RepID=A0A081KAX9_9GAMM|nr:hypothetical protein [Endozoicomonas elysicola]KEI71305.1 hypothetical protein GV64_11660 [Endozoicomonas elysicola]
MPSNLLKVLGSIFALVILITAGVMVMQSAREQFAPSEKNAKALEAKVIEGFELAAQQLNAMTPLMVDEETRMEKATVGPGALMTYHYTFPNFTAKDIDINIMRAGVFPIIRDGVCDSAEMKPSLQYGGKYAYSYSGNDGVHIMKFVITRSDCRFEAEAENQEPDDTTGILP